MITGEWRWKTGVVTSLPKPGKDSTSVNGYRPITLTSYIVKLLERIMESKTITLFLPFPPFILCRTT